MSDSESTKRSVQKAPTLYSGFRKNYIAFWILFVFLLVLVIVVFVELTFVVVKLQPFVESLNETG